MQVQQLFRATFGRAQMVTSMLINDLSDDEILQRPVPEANHIAWQLGHLISALHFFGEAIKPGSMPALPDGFNDQHNKETAKSDDPAKFLKKDEYATLLDQQRDAMLKLSESLSDEELSAAAPEEMRQYAPTVLDMVGLAAEHEMMHSGQVSVLRRKLGKPVAF
jgi:uncharacterized damage-inducible protein DinB